jgi:hypothetical protein
VVIALVHLCLSGLPAADPHPFWPRAKKILRILGGCWEEQNVVSSASRACCQIVPVSLRTD